MRRSRIVGLSLLVLLCGDRIEGKEPSQAQEQFPNLFYKLDVARSKEAAFYLQKYEIKQPQYTSEEKFKKQVVQTLLAFVANQEKWALAERGITYETPLTQMRSKTETYATQYREK